MGDAVGGLESIAVVGLLPSGVVAGVVCLVVGLLIDADIIYPRLVEGGILLGREGLDLEAELGEMRADMLDDLQVVLP